MLCWVRRISKSHCGYDKHAVFFGWVGCETVFIMATVRSFLMIFKCLRVFLVNFPLFLLFYHNVILFICIFLVFIANAVYTNEFQCSNGFLVFVITHTSSFISFFISKDMHSIQFFLLFFMIRWETQLMKMCPGFWAPDSFFSNIVEPCHIKTLTKDQRVIGIG